MGKQLASIFDNDPYNSHIDCTPEQRIIISISQCIEKYRGRLILCWDYATNWELEANLWLQLAPLKKIRWTLALQNCRRVNANVSRLLKPWTQFLQNTLIVIPIIYNRKKYHRQVKKTNRDLKTGNGQSRIPIQIFLIPAFKILSTKAWWFYRN